MTKSHLMTMWKKLWEYDKKLWKCDKKLWNETKRKNVTKSQWRYYQPAKMSSKCDKMGYRHHKMSYPSCDKQLHICNKKLNRFEEWWNKVLPEFSKLVGPCTLVMAVAEVSITEPVVVAVEVRVVKSQQVSLCFNMNVATFVLWW